MRKWDQEQEKPAVKAVIDRRQLLLGTVTLLAMAALLIVGLTPRRAAAPEDGPDAAQAGSDAAALLLETCQVTQHMTFTPCGHELTRRQVVPTELVGKGRAEVEAAYDQWQVTAFSPEQVEMERALDIYCPEHVVLMPDDSGHLCAFRNQYGDALALIKETGVLLTDLPDAYQEELRPGKGFDTEEALDLWLESIES